jgi:hypothetical protein
MTLAARALGLSIPPTVLAQATELIQEAQARARGRLHSTWPPVVPGLRLPLCRRLRRCEAGLITEHTTSPRKAAQRPATAESRRAEPDLTAVRYVLAAAPLALAQFLLARRGMFATEFT